MDVLQEMLAVIGDLELTRRQLAQRIIDLEARVKELEAEKAEKE